MALLSWIPRTRTASRAALIAAVAGLAGCAILTSLDGGPRSFAFSHKIHVGDQELECGSCHPGAETADEPGFVLEPACMLCHADTDEDAPPERKVASLFEDKRFRTANVTELGEAFVFPHLRHVQAGLECGACHTGIEENEDVLTLPRVTMDVCRQCHASRGVSNECATCHPGINVDTPPSTHTGNWTRLHGGRARAGSDASADRCETCHAPTACSSCHETVMPDSHNDYWRRRGHGISASLDRETCSTCHRPDTCSSCHQQVAPQSHVGSWGAPMDRHCFSCHYPVQNEGCSVCHSGTPSHDLAPPKPAGHNPASDCRQCHVPPSDHQIPHVDNGDNCNLCHH